MSHSPCLHQCKNEVRPDWLLSSSDCIMLFFVNVHNTHYHKKHYVGNCHTLHVRSQFVTYKRRMESKLFTFSLTAELMGKK